MFDFSFLCVNLTFMGSENKFSLQADRGVSTQFGMLDFLIRKQSGGKNKQRAEEVRKNRQQANEQLAQEKEADLLEHRAFQLGRISGYIQAQIDEVKKRKNLRSLRRGMRDAADDGHESYEINSGLLVGPLLSATITLQNPDEGFPDGSRFQASGTQAIISIAPITFTELNQLPKLAELDALIDEKVGSNYKTVFEGRDMTPEDTAEVKGMNLAKEKQVISFRIISTCAHCNQEEEK